MLRENIPDLADLELVAAVADKAVRVKQPPCSPTAWAPRIWC